MTDVEALRDAIAEEQRRAADELTHLRAVNAELAMACEAVVRLWDAEHPADPCGCLGASPDCPHPPPCELCMARTALVRCPACGSNAALAAALEGILAVCDTAPPVEFIARLSHALGPARDALAKHRGDRCVRCPMCGSNAVVYTHPNIPGPFGWGGRCQTCRRAWSQVPADAGGG